MDLNYLVVDEIIISALKEDIGTGDVTTYSIVPEDYVGTAFLLAKEDGVLAGIRVAERVFWCLDNQIRFTVLKNDGASIKKGEVLAEVYGSGRALLTGERVALNLLQRMSGIATKTRKLVNLVAGSKTKVVDTRKTIPGLRILEKYAVTVGGGANHRIGLYDGVLIKDNHIKVAGGITQAVNKAKRALPHTLKIEVEVESIEGVQEALDARADVIMLDNMDINKIKQALSLINGRALVEVSGGITEEKLHNLADLGIDLISVGALTHSVKALDISMDIGEIKPIK